MSARPASGARTAIRTSASTTDASPLGVVNAPQIEARLCALCYLLALFESLLGYEIFRRCGRYFHCRLFERLFR